MGNSKKEVNKESMFPKIIKKSYKYIFVLLIAIFFMQRGTSALEGKLIEEKISVKNLGYIENVKDEKLILVNRDNKIEADYEPSNLVELNVRFLNNNVQNNLLEEEAAIQLERMFEDAKKDGVNLLGVSGYRSYEYQKKLYEKKVKSYGKYEADKYVAEPGTSEHQTGLAIDILSTEYKKLDEGFKNTYAYSWLDDNMEEYGFIIRYKEGKKEITGYEFEPWHLRYVGKELAKELKDRDITLEEYYDTYQGKVAIK